MEVENNRFVLDRIDQQDLALVGLDGWPIQHGGIFLKIIKEIAHINLVETPASLEQHQEYARINTIKLRVEAQLASEEA